MTAGTRSTGTARAKLFAAGMLAVIAGIVGIVGIVGIAGLAAAPEARAATDPFYLDLLRDGSQAYDRGDYTAAAKQLRLACFGVLDEPERLAGCLTRLALAHGAAGDNRGFRKTLRTIAEVENPLR